MTKKILTKNSYYEGLLQDLYCGNDVLFSNFLHFFYQYNNIFVFYEKFSNEFQTLYKLELEACESVCKVIFSMGGDPKYFSANKKYISGMNIDYVKNLKNIVEFDIELIEKSLIDVKNVISKIDDVEIKARIKNILQIKKTEEKILKNLFLKLNQIN